MVKKLKKLKDDKSGATAIEYGLIASLISVAIIIGLGNFSEANKTTFECADNVLEGRFANKNPNEGACQRYKTK